MPPSLLAQRVLVSLTPNGTQGILQILDGLRDIRNNVPNTIAQFQISGFSAGNPTQIINYPEQSRGYVYSDAAPSYSLIAINYGTETTQGAVGTFPGRSSSIATASDGRLVFSAEEVNGQLVVFDNTLGRAFTLNLPGVYRVASNQGDTIALAMVRNSDALYRVVKLNLGSSNPPGSVDCQPTVLPVYCVVPVAGKFDRPANAIYSADGSQVYVLNCGQECGGGANGGAGVSFLPQGALTIDVIPTSLPYPTLVANTVAIPGGATVGLSDGVTLYLAGQQQQPDGLFSGRLTRLTLANLAVSDAVPVSDGLHTKMLFADDNTLWIGSQRCATGERFKTGQNYNCLTRYDRTANTASIVPAVNPQDASQVPYPNQDNNLKYYGSLTGLCWVQTYHKVYTAYGGQVHAFRTVDGSEINNSNITVQGTALDVAYMDAITNEAN